jgi:hypothetical protein
LTFSKKDLTFQNPCYQKIEGALWDRQTSTFAIFFVLDEEASQEFVASMETMEEESKVVATESMEVEEVRK